MALLHTPVDQTKNHFVSVSLNELPLNNFFDVHGLAGNYANKWMFLIAEQIGFASPCQMGVRLQKPTETKLYQWMEKIVVAGQCAVLFVENLQLDDLRVQRIKQLCERHQVTLVNLTLGNVVPKNVVVGPWH